MKNIINKKKVSVSLVLATLMLIFNVSNCFAASSDSGSYNGIVCSGSVGYGTTSAWGTTECYGEHESVEVSISVRYISGYDVKYGSSYAEDYYVVETEFGDSSYEILGVIGSHYVNFHKGGVWAGSTDSGSY